MSILQVPTTIPCPESTTTDWIQAIGAIIAIIAVIVGFYQLYKDSKEKQSQIDTLTKLAKQSKKQTNHLALQVDEMIKGNELLRKNVNLIQKNVSISEKTLKIYQEKYEQDKLKRKLEIQPQFKLDASSTNYRLSRGNTVYFDNSLRLTFENIREKATIKEFFRLESNEIEIDFSEYIDRDCLKGTSFNKEHKWESSEPILGILIHYKIIYEDIENNKYCQIIEGKYGEPIKIGKPIEII